jgi:hypothetical protein
MTDMVTTSAGDLSRALRAALLFADDADGWPTLSAVYVETSAGRLTATATNRYVLGRAFVSATGDLPHGVLLDADDASLIATYLADVNKADLVTLRLLESHITGERVRVEHGERGFAIEAFDMSDRSSQTPWVDYPRVLARFEETAAQPAPGDVPAILLQPSVVAPVAALADVYAEEPARWTFLGELEPVRVELGKAFTAVLMPAKPSDQTRSYWPQPAAASVAG